MRRKSKHKETSNWDEPFEYPLVVSGYLDTRKLSNNTELQEKIYDPNIPLKCPPVEPGYLGTTDQSDIQGEKNSFYHKIIWSCVFIILVLSASILDSPEYSGLFIILIPLTVILFLADLLSQ